MTLYFVDTSAIAKRYLEEVGANWVRSWIASNPIVISDITPIEMLSVFARKRRENSISAEHLAAARSEFLFHVHQKEYIVATLDSQLLTLARTLVERHLLRTLDAIQLSAASWVKTVVS